MAAVLGAPLWVATPALADEQQGSGSGHTPTSTGSAATGTTSSGPQATGEATATPPAADPNAQPAQPADPNAKPAEPPPDPNKISENRFLLGARFRDFIVPAFMFHLFVDGGPGAVNVFSAGPEFTVQQGALVISVSLTIPYADYSMNEFVFKSKTDPDQAYEIVSSSLKLITASVDLLGRIPFDKKGSVALLIGGGVGISGVIGDIRRTQAYPDDPNAVDPDTPAKWHKCRAPDDPAVRTPPNPDEPEFPNGHRYCDDDNDHYPTNPNGDLNDAENAYSEPYWTDGGSKPVIFPYLALPHIALEVSPIDQLMFRIDSGFSITGFFFGLAAGGKLPI